MKTPKTKQSAAQPAVGSKSRQLQMPKLPPGVTQDRAACEIVANGAAANAATTIAYTPDFGELSITDMVAVLQASGQAVNRGDLSGLEGMLTAQAVALNATFNMLARRSSESTYLDTADRYLRLALKAQSQCRATVETLAAIKNPPVVFARQANIAHGPQQVNNGTAAESGTVRAGAHAHPGENAFKPTELLEDLNNGRTQLDTRATSATGRANQDMAAVGAFNRPAQR